MKKRIFVVIVLALLLILTIANVSAITGRMGNSRMILRLEPGETVEKYIKVENVNDMPITIDMEPSGDLADYVKLDEKTFTLQPGEDKKAYFTIKAGKAGTTETKINVRFTPPEGNGVGLSSTIIIIAGEATDDSDDVNDDANDDSGFSFHPSGNVIDDSDSSGISLPKILIASTSLLIVVLIVLSIYSFKLKPKKSSGRAGD